MSLDQTQEEQRRIVWSRLYNHRFNLAKRLETTKEQYLRARRELNPRSTQVESSHDPLYRDTNEDDVLALYIAGGLTQLSLCMILSVVYWGLSAISASWHLLGVHGPRLLSAPVGTLLIRILDHLLIAVMCGVLGRSWMEENLVRMVFAIVSWAKMSCWTGLACPPVRTRFPFIDQFAEDMCMCCALDI